MKSCLDMRDKIKDLDIVKDESMFRLINMIEDFRDTFDFDNIIPMLTHSVFDLRQVKDRSVCYIFSCTYLLCSPTNKLKHMYLSALSSHATVTLGR